MRIALVMLAALTAAAQPLVTPIRDTVYDQSGHVYDGPLTVTLSVKSASAGAVPVLSVPLRLQIKAGVLSLDLVPNVALTPAGTAYVLTWGNGGQKTCTIPVSSSPIQLAPYCTDNAPQNPTPSIPALWISTVGAREGYCIKLVSGLPKWAYCGSGSTSTLVGRTWTSLVGTTWTSLIGTTWQ